MQTDTIYTDFSKAFDTVNHDMFLMKLNIIGLPTLLLQWIKSYLSNRIQRVLRRQQTIKYQKILLRREDHL